MEFESEILPNGNPDSGKKTTCSKRHFTLTLVKRMPNLAPLKRMFSTIQTSADPQAV
jgi:hypothetical protein